jgi:iron-sulfur cluster insertion protein
MNLPPNASEDAFRRLREINEGKPEDQQKMLRLAVLGGGCSGFQYEFELVDAKDEDDLVLEGEGQRILVDAISLPFLQGAVIDFADELVGARFVVNNPTATASCGCGTSFSI